jgi:hypothetical protein
VGSYSDYDPNSVENMPEDGWIGDRYTLAELNREAESESGH